MIEAITGDNKAGINTEKIQLVTGGRGYFNLLVDLINSATSCIHLQTYIFTEDETGKTVADALMAAAKRNVAVYLLVDGYASQHLSTSFVKALELSGVHFRFFEPLFSTSNFYFGRRLHHKLFVADAKHALVGGINIANRYNDVDGIAAWLDFAVCAQGVVAQDLCELCWKIWHGFSAKAVINCAENLSLAAVSKNIDASQVHVKRNDWVSHKNEISSSYIAMFRHARFEITIMCSYFLPGKIIRRLLRKASQRGVHIKVVIAGPSDIWIAKQAERWLYDWLLRNNIELYEYQPSVLHAKIAVADNEWMTIGSYNINDISTYASIELNLEITDADFTGGVRRQLDAIIKNDCKRISRNKSRYSENIFIQFVRWICYQSIRIIFYLFTFYFKQKRKSEPTELVS